MAFYPRQSLLFPFAPWMLMIGTIGLASPTLAGELANVIERCEKSVVRLEVTGKNGNDGLGSGFVVTQEGMFVTNVHVLAGAQSAIAIFPDGKRYEVTGTYVIDKGKDICIAQMDVKDGLPIDRATSLPRKGQNVTALGAPFGLSFTATQGIVSAIRTGKELSRDLGDDSMQGTWIQVDAALSPGNSGGPLINSKGEVVAMSTRASAGGRAQNLNFGISVLDINDAIVDAEDNSLQTLRLGVGLIEDSEFGPSGGGGGGGITRKKIPDEALEEYVETGRERFRDLARDLRRLASLASDELQDMKKGLGYIPVEFGLRSRDMEMVKVPGRISNSWYFRSERAKRLAVRRKEARVSELDRIKKEVSDGVTDRSMLMLLSHAGPLLDPRDKYSIGFMEGAVVLHAFNDHEVIVRYDGQPFLMWAESTTGLSLGEEVPPVPVFVAGTETAEIPGLTTMAVTVLQEVTETQLENAIKKSARYETWRDTSGAYTIEARYIRSDGENVQLGKRDGSELTVPISRLDSHCVETIRRYQSP